MIRFAKMGPSALHTGRYHFEQTPPNDVGLRQRSV